MRYTEKLAARITKTGSALCVGLDPRPGEGGVGELEAFVERIIEETSEFAACFKPNMAYFEAFGSPGVAALERLLQRIPSDIPIVLDAKRGDIGETQKYYAKAYFETWNVDAVTLSPYMGYDSVEPFLGYEGKGVYLLAVTSNVGAADIEMVETAAGRNVFEHVTDFASRSAGSPCDVGFVVGLTNASGEVLAKMPDAPLLIPGLGAQGGDLGALAGSGKIAPNVINVSRGILQAESAREAAQKYAAQIAAVLNPQ